MEGSNGDREFDVGSIIQEVKDDVNGPGVRAQKVYAHLLTNGELTNWDLVCFAAEVIASYAGTMVWLKEVARSLVRIVYTAHYMRFQETGAWLDKPISAREQQSSDTATEGSNG